MRREDYWLEDWPRALAYDSKQNAFKNAARFLANRPFKIIASDGICYSLECGLWHALDDDELLAEIQATNTELRLSPHQVRGVLSAIKIDRYTTARPYTWLDRPRAAPEPTDLVPFGNGLLDCVTGKLWKYDGRFFVTGAPEYLYQPDAKCQLWILKLSEWLSPDFIQTLQEFFGYAMTSDISYQTILALIGARRGGKSTIASILERLVGKANVASRILNDLSGDHGLEGLQDKKLLIIPDASDAETNRRATGLSRIKSISGGDTVSINPKHQKIIDTRIPARIVIVANKHPKLLDESAALAARELPIIFTKSWDDNNPARDPLLFDKLLSELPGIANWALEGLRRLRSNNAFTKGPELLRARREIEFQQSPALRFSACCLIVTGKRGDFCSTEAMFDAYSAWTWEEELSRSERRNRTDFGMDLRAALAPKGVRYGQKRDPHDGKRRRGWWGVTLRHDSGTADGPT